jgi:molecular chaperone DnaK (HSP70)
VYTRGQRWALPANTLPSIGDGQQEDGGRQGAGGIGIGIDLGTTYSAVAYLRDGRVPTIVPVDGERTLPSVVQFLSRAGEGNSIVTGSDDDHEDDDRDGRVVVVGRRACSSLDAYRNFKRVIGTGGRIPRDVAAVVPHLVPNSANGSTRKKNTLANQLDDAVRFPTLLAGSGSDPSVRAPIKPEVLSGYVLKKLKRAAESHTGQKVTRGSFVASSRGRRDAVASPQRFCD